MESSDREDRALAVLLAERARTEAGELGTSSPEPEELLAFLEDRLEPEEARRLERRLIADPETAAQLLDLEDFAAAEAAAGSRPPEVATHAGWRDFQRRPGTGPARRRPPPAWLTAIAAALLFAALGLAVWVWKLRSPEPQVVANLATLELVAQTRGAAPEIALAAGAPLRLVLAPEERCASYRAVIRRVAGGAQAWSRTVPGLERDPLGRVSLLLSAGPGSYSLVLSGCDRPRQLEHHDFRIVRAE